MRYALTKGVEIREARIEKTMAVIKTGLYGSCYLHGSDFQISEEGAKTRLGEMIQARRKSIKKELAKLDAIEQAGTLPMKKVAK